MGEDVIAVTAREEKRALALNRVLAGDWTTGEAAEALGLSVRQVRRLKAAYDQEGIRALVHGNRGRSSHFALASEVRARVVELARGRYAGCNDQHFTELLAEREGLTLSRESVRRVLRAAGIRSPRRRRAPKHRSRRERMPAEGMLLQIDGSRHAWLEDRGPSLTLIGGIDDATGRVPYAVFREQEDAQGYFLLLQEVVRRSGRPLAVYRDRHLIFERSTRDRPTIAEQMTGKRDPTQFGRLLEELEITSIPAQSPQAKGRIERVWGTFQDRLVAELRLAQVSTIADANRLLGEFLSRFNAQFTVPPTDPRPAYRPFDVARRPEEVFCFKFPRVVAADNTVQFGPHRIQLLAGPNRLSYAKATVELHERMDGSLAVYYQGQRLATQAAPSEAPKLRLDRKTKPLSWDQVRNRSRAAVGPNPFSPWRRSTPAADKITEQLSGQNH
jgi:transposase